MKLRLVLVTLVIALAILAFVSWKHFAQDSIRQPSERVLPVELQVPQSEPTLDLLQGPAMSERTVGVATTAQQSTSSAQSRANATLKVLVVSKETRRPLPHVHVWLSIPGSAKGSNPTDTESSHGTLNTRTTTGADGRVDFELPTGSAFDLIASADDHSAGWGRADVTALAPGETREIVVELSTEDDFVFFGSVVDRDTREPVPAEIYISPSTDRRGSSTVITHADGRFDTRLASWLNPSLAVRAAGYASVTVIPDRLHDRSDRSLVIFVGRTAKLSVRLSDAHGAALADVHVHLTATSSQFLQPQATAKTRILGATDWSAEGETDARGVYEFVDVPSEVDISGEVTRTRPSFFNGEGALGTQVLFKAQDALRLKPGEAREVVWIVGSGAELHGRVLDASGAPVAHYPIWLIESRRATSESFLEKSRDKARTTTTDERGEFVYTEVTAGGWCVGPGIKRTTSALADPDLVAPRAVFFEIASGEARHDVEIRTDRGLYIRGRVLDPRGAPIDKARVTAHSLIPNFFAMCEVGVDGEFAIGPLVRASYKLSASNWPTYGSSASVDCEAGESGIVLQLVLGGRIAGTVIDGETKQPTEARVNFRLSGGSNDRGGMTQTKPNGMFRFGPIDTNTYDIIASDSRQRFGIVRGIAVADGEEKTGITVTLEPGAHVRVRYAGKAQFAVLRVAAEGTTIANETLEPSVVRDYDVPRGRVTLSMKLEGSDRSVERVFDLAAGETKDVEIGDDGR